MTTIDGTRAPGTLLLDGATLDYLDGESLRTGRSPAELVRLIVTADAIARAEAEIATSVDGGVRQLPGRPGVDAGQGTTRLPATTTAPKVLTPVAPNMRGEILCSKGTRFGCSTPAKWWCRPNRCSGDACCNDHIPDGWVRPDERPVPEHVHLDGGPCVYGDRCGR